MGCDHRKEYMTDNNEERKIESRTNGWDQDLFELKDGGHDSALNKDIKEVVLVSDTFIVYIATDLSIQWRCEARLVS